MIKRWKKFEYEMRINKNGKISLDIVDCVNLIMFSLIVLFSTFVVFFGILFDSFNDEILVLYDSGGASTFLDDFLVLFLSAFGELSGFVGKFLLWLLTTMCVSGFLHLLEVFDRESVYFFGRLILELDIFVGVSGGSLIWDFGGGLLVEYQDLSSKLLALGFEVFIEPLKEIALNDRFVEFFLQTNHLHLSFLILPNKFLELILVDVKVITALEITKLLLEFVIFFAQIFYRFIQSLYVGGRCTVIGAFRVVWGLRISEKSLFWLDTMKSHFVFGAGQFVTGCCVAGWSVRVTIAIRRLDYVLYVLSVFCHCLIKIWKDLYYGYYF